MAQSIGIDLGSRTTKIISLDEENITFKEVFPTGADPLARVRKTLAQIQPAPLIATGYGRYLLGENLGAARVTEIRACARGAFQLHPECRIILDVGGQDCKVIETDERGNVVDFEMNDRCAAGTGKFLEIMAQTLGVSMDELVKMSLAAKRHIAINSMCAVFAESEVVSMIASGKPPEEIALGLHATIAGRLGIMLSRFAGRGEILFVGGGAKNDCLYQLLKKETGSQIKRPADPQTVAAFGAALFRDINR